MGGWARPVPLPVPPGLLLPLRCNGKRESLSRRSSALWFRGKRAPTAHMIRSVAASVCPIARLSAPPVPPVFSHPTITPPLGRDLMLWPPWAGAQVVTGAPAPVPTGAMHQGPKNIRDWQPFAGAHCHAWGPVLRMGRMTWSGGRRTRNTNQLGPEHSAVSHHRFPSAVLPTGGGGGDYNRS